MTTHLRKNKKTFWLLAAILILLVPAATVFAAQSVTYLADPAGPGGVVNGLKLWLKADAGVYSDVNCTTLAAVNGSVGCWQDQSGNGLNATHGIASQQPIYRANRTNGKPALEYGGNDRLSTAATQLFATGNSAVTVFVVFDTDNNNGQKFLLNQGFSPKCVNSFELGIDTGFTSGTGNFGLHVGCSRATIAPVGTIASNTFYVMSTLILSSGNTPNNINFFQNGTAVLPLVDNAGGYANAGSYNIGSAPIDVGARNDFGSGNFNAFYDGDIAEVIIYQRTLSTAERSTVECYLGDKYGLIVADCDDPDSDGDGVNDEDDPFPNSNLDPTVAIGGCDSGVDNQSLGDGSTFNDLIGQAGDDAANHGKFVSAVSDLSNDWKKAGLISGKEKGKITSCAARSDIP